MKTIGSHARGPLELIVVETDRGNQMSAPRSGRRSAPTGSPLVEEPTPGLSRARNAGLAEATGSIVAFVDDDVVVDDHWLDALRQTFAAYPEAICVTGQIEPLE